MPKLTHFTNTGNARMVDVSNKQVCLRIAKAVGVIKMQPSTIKLIKQNKIIKGECLTVAKIAGINAAKKVGELIPLSHNLNPEWIDLNFKIGSDRIEIWSEVKIESKTGVEMEALTAVAVSALTIYDMCKSVDKKMKISDIILIEKQKF